MSYANEHKIIACPTCKSPNGGVYDATKLALFCIDCGSGVRLDKTPPIPFKTEPVQPKIIYGRREKTTNPNDVVADFYDTSPDDPSTNVRTIASLAVLPRVDFEMSPFDVDTPHARFAVFYYKDRFEARRRYNQSRTSDSSVGASDGPNEPKPTSSSRRNQKGSGEAKRLSSGESLSYASVGGSEHPHS